ncbi:MAG: hypothetical protein ACLUKN_07095 [Bacilli bacterium]
MKKNFLWTHSLSVVVEVINSDLYGITACSTLGHLTNNGVITACEGDVYGAVLMRLEYELTGESPFFAISLCANQTQSTAWFGTAARSMQRVQKEL